MTEMTEDTPVLVPAARRFVLHWGEMGSRWGVNRTVGQIHALLLLSPRALTAEEIAGALSVARSGVSTGIRELQAWALVRVVHALGDRRDRFEALPDTWEMFRVIAEERRRREIDPTIGLLRQCLAGKGADAPEPHARRRLQDLLGFFETMTAWHAEVAALPREALAKFLRMGARLRKWLGTR